MSNRELAELFRSIHRRLFWCERHHCHKTVRNGYLCSWCIIESVYNTTITSIQEIMSR